MAEKIDLDFEGKKPVYRYKCPQCGKCDSFDLTVEMVTNFKYLKKETEQISEYPTCKIRFEEPLDIPRLTIRCGNCGEELDDEGLFEKIWWDLHVAVLASDAETVIDHERFFEDIKNE